MTETFRFVWTRRHWSTDRVVLSGAEKIGIGGTRGALPLLRRRLPVPSALRPREDAPGHFIGSPAFLDHPLLCSLVGVGRGRALPDMGKAVASGIDALHLADRVEALEGPPLHVCEGLAEREDDPHAVCRALPMYPKEPLATIELRHRGVSS